jgi:type IV pilus assembly protein PilW
MATMRMASARIEGLSSSTPPRRRARRRRRATGFTLIEMMVSLVIGLAVVGALVAAYVASSQSGRHNEAMVQITEDATLALSVMRQQVAQAGFSMPRAAEAGWRLHAFPAVLGCEAANFRDLQAGILGSAGCDAPGRDPSSSDALEVAYEGSVLAGATSNGILGGASGKEPLDCLGNSFPKTADPANGDYYLIDSKFYVSGGSLYCHGPGNSAGAVVVQNVETLQLAYGMALAPAGMAGADQVAYYDVAPPAGSPLWANVVAVAICVQVRSAAKVLDTAATATLGGYVDCRNATRASSDGYLHRSFSTTIVLQNKLP